MLGGEGAGLVRDRGEWNRDIPERTAAQAALNPVARKSLAGALSPGKMVPGATCPARPEEAIEGETITASPLPVEFPNDFRLRPTVGRAATCFP